jgi:hypothetical protein
MMRRWWIGLVTGAVAGTGTLLAGTLGAGLGLIAVVLAVAQPPRGAAIGGVLVGQGVTWLVLFGRGILACQEGCVGPELMPWLALAGLLTGLGAIVTWRVSRRPG